MTNELWTGCYQGTYDLWAPESYCHPAKMAPGLCYRIFEHLKEIGWLNDGSTVLDPMGGIGTTALVDCSLGLKAVTVELEAKFVCLQEQNREYVSRRMHRPLGWTILRGDSRRLSQILAERGLVTVTSPPYSHDGEPHRAEPMEEWRGGRKWGGPNSVVRAEGYGGSPGQIGQLPDKPIAITSPPYESQTGSNGKMASGSIPHDSSGNFYRQDYGASDGQIGQETQESYLSAMALVYGEIAKVSNRLVVVLKNPTRNGKLRRLDLDTIALLEAGGWTIHCVHQAQLFSEHQTTDLFGETKKKLKGRVSFFKRLSYNRGQVIADHEDILCAERVGTGSVVTVSSPPYFDQGVKIGGVQEGTNSLRQFVGKDAGKRPEGYGSTPGNIGNLR